MAMHTIECPVCGSLMEVGGREFAAQERGEPLGACSIECDRRARRIVRDAARVRAMLHADSASERRALGLT